MSPSSPYLIDLDSGEKLPDPVPPFVAVVTVYEMSEKVAVNVQPAAGTGPVVYVVPERVPGQAGLLAAAEEPASG